MIDFSKVSEIEEVVELLKQREEIERKIKQLDEYALIRYEISRLDEIPSDFIQRYKERWNK